MDKSTDDYRPEETEPLSRFDPEKDSRDVGRICNALTTPVDIQDSHEGPENKSDREIIVESDSLVDSAFNSSSGTADLSRAGSHVSQSGYRSGVDTCGDSYAQNVRIATSTNVNIQTIRTDIDSACAPNNTMEISADRNTSPNTNISASNISVDDSPAAEDCESLQTHSDLDKDTDVTFHRIDSQISISALSIVSANSLTHTQARDDETPSLTNPLTRDGETPQDISGSAGVSRSLTPLSDLIKRALSDKRHVQHLKVPQFEEDSSRLYQSDSYLPALRLQLDTQRSPPPYQRPSHYTLPRSAGKHRVRFPSPPQIIVGERCQHEESDHSSCSYQGSSNVSLDDADFLEEKSSPPISPLTKGLHCSSLSLYLPPPSISSLNKMWHRCYSADSANSDLDERDGSGDGGGKKAGEKSVPYDLAAKVILLGDYSVGKTSFLSTLSKAKDENGSGFCREYRSGELAEVVFKRQQKRAMIRVMDTGGQERYRSMTSSYYRGVHGCLLVFDVTREETFNNIMIWHADLLKYSTDQYVAAILVGTTSHPGERVISPERGLKMAESLGMPYMECSPEDASMTLAIVQRLTESVIKFALRRSSFAIDIKPQNIVRLEEKKKKTFVCLC